MDSLAKSPMGRLRGEATTVPRRLGKSAISPSRRWSRVGSSPYARGLLRDSGAAPILREVSGAAPPALAQGLRKGVCEDRLGIRHGWRLGTAESAGALGPRLGVW
jgi:hypothetical protein